MPPVKQPAEVMLMPRLQKAQDEPDLQQILKLISEAKRNKNSDGSISVPSQTLEMIETFLQKQVVQTSNDISSVTVPSSSRLPQKNYEITAGNKMETSILLPDNQAARLTKPVFVAGVNADKKLQRLVHSTQATQRQRLRAVGTKISEDIQNSNSSSTDHIGGVNRSTALKVYPSSKATNNSQSVGSATISKHIKMVPVQAETSARPSSVTNCLDEQATLPSSTSKFEFISVSENVILSDYKKPGTININATPEKKYRIKAVPITNLTSNKAASIHQTASPSLSPKLPPLRLLPITQFTNLMKVSKGEAIAGALLKEHQSLLENNQQPEKLGTAPNSNNRLLMKPLPSVKDNPNIPNPTSLQSTETLKKQSLPAAAGCRVFIKSVTPKASVNMVQGSSAQKDSLNTTTQKKEKSSVSQKLDFVGVAPNNNKITKQNPPNNKTHYNFNENQHLKSCEDSRTMGVQSFSVNKWILDSVLDSSTERPQRDRKPNKRFISPPPDTICHKSRKIKPDKTTTRLTSSDINKINEELSSATAYLKSLSFSDDSSSLIYEGDNAPNLKTVIRPRSSSTENSKPRTSEKQMNAKPLPRRTRYNSCPGVRKHISNSKNTPSKLSINQALIKESDVNKQMNAKPLSRRTRYNSCPGIRKDISNSKNILSKLSINKAVIKESDVNNSDTSMVPMTVMDQKGNSDPCSLTTDKVLASKKSLPLKKLTYDGHVVSASTLEILNTAKWLRPVLNRLPSQLNSEMHSTAWADLLDSRFEVAVESLINDMKKAKPNFNRKSKFNKRKAIKFIMHMLIKMDQGPAIDFELPEEYNRNEVNTKKNIKLHPHNTQIDNMHERRVGNANKKKIDNADDVNMSNIHVNNIKAEKIDESNKRVDQCNEAKVNADPADDAYIGVTLCETGNEMDLSDGSSTSSKFDEENPRESSALNNSPPTLSPENICVISDDEADDYCPPLSPHELTPASLLPNTMPSQSPKVTKVKTILNSKIQQIAHKSPLDTPHYELPPKAIMGLSSSGNRIPLIISKVESLHPVENLPKNVSGALPKVPSELSKVSAALPVISKITCHVVPLNAEERNAARKLPTVLRTWAKCKSSNFFKCPEFSCTYMTNDERSFEHHISESHTFGTSLIPCIYCNYKMRVLFYITHLIIRHAKCSFTSEYCFYRAMRSEYVKMHYALAHPNKEFNVGSADTPVTHKRYRLPQLPPITSVLKPHICSCKQTFYCRQNYAVHRKTCRLESSQNRHFTYEDHSCRYCPFGARFSLEILVHITIEHPYQDVCIIYRGRVDKLVSNIEAPDILEHLLIFRNEYLENIREPSLGIAAKGFRSKHYKDSIKCWHLPFFQAPQRFQKLPNIPEPVLSSMLYRCGKCKELIHDEEAFRIHLRTHPSPMKCGHCGIFANHEEDMLCHIKLHGYPLYMCNECCFTNNSFAIVKTHSFTHGTNWSRRPALFMIRCNQAISRVPHVACKQLSPKSSPKLDKMEMDVASHNKSEITT